MGSMEAPIDKQVVDIDLNGGLDESRPEEAINWQNGFSNVKNLNPNSGAYDVRNGVQVLKNTDSGGTTLGTLYRLLNIKDSLGVVGSGFQLYHWSDTAQQLYNKGKLPEFSVRHLRAGSASPPTAVSGVAGVGVTSNYLVIAYMGENNDSTAASWLHIDIMDLDGEVIIKSLRLEDTGTYSYAMVVVDSRYLHIYRSGAAEAPKMFVIDTNSLPTGPVLSTPTYTTLTGGAAGDNVQGVVAISGASVSLLRFATLPTSNNYRLEKFNNSGTSTANQSVAGFIPGGIDTDGTNFYVVGRADSFTDPVSQNLSFWVKPAYGGASPWQSQASAGISTGYRFVTFGAAAPIASANNLNGLVGAGFNAGNQGLQTNTNAGAAAAASTFISTTAGTIIMVLRLNSLPALDSTKLLLGTSTPTNYIRYNNPYGLWWGTAAPLISTSTTTPRPPASLYFPVNINQPLVVAWKWNNTTGYAKVNSSDWVSTTDASGRPSSVAGNLVLGGASAADFGDIYEFIVSPNNESERWVEDVMQYLRVKYAVDF